MAKIWKQPKRTPTGGPIKKEGMVYIYSEILFSHEREGNPASGEDMDTP